MRMMTCHLWGWSRVSTSEYLKTDSAMALKHPYPRAQNTHPLLSGPAAHLEEVGKNEGPGDSPVGSPGPSPMPETSCV